MIGTKEWVLLKSFLVQFMKNRLLNFAQEVAHANYQNQKDITSNLPPYYIIEPTNYCNYACRICPNRFYKDSEKGFMDFGLFSKILEQIKDVAEVIQLYWLGEPLLHPQIIMMIEACKAKTHAKVMISTNGSLLSEEFAKKLVDARLDKLIVSMDAAASNEIYQSIRCNGNIELLNNNVSNLLKYASTLDITLQFILTFENQCEKEAFIKKWENKGVKISIQCLYTWANQMSELKKMSDYLSPMIAKSRVPCADLWYKMAIHWDGHVSRCCFDWSFDSCVGDVKKDSVFDVWNSAQMRNLRKQHCKADYAGICKNCDAWATEEEYDTLFD